MMGSWGIQGAVAVQGSPAGAQAPSAPAAPPRVLCVDDEPNILSALRRLFRGRGWEILTAEGGPQALALLAQQPVDVVVSDMRMPEMDGAAFLQQVYARWPQTGRILLTGYADMASTIAAINEARIDRFVSKPWNELELPLVVQQVLDHRHLVADRDRLQTLTQRQNAEFAQLNAQLEVRVQERTHELAQANERLKANWLATVTMFTGLMELRDGAMAGHARRVAQLARRIAQAMRLSASDCQDVFLAGLLHDLGKLGLPDPVLRKPIRLLDAQELAHYRTHPLRAEKALMPLAEFQGAIRLIRAHHERHDGRGFPHGLSGEAIPIGARILALANEVDNLLQGQLSEVPATMPVVLQRAQAASGTRYDPVVVAAWVALETAEPTPQDRISLVLAELKPGDRLLHDLANDDGLLLLAADHAVDLRMVDHLLHYFGPRARTLRVEVHPRPVQPG